MRPAPRLRQAAAKSVQRKLPASAHLLCAQDAAKAALAELKASSCGSDDMTRTARFGSGCAKTEAELKVAKVGAEEGVRKQRRLTAKLQARLQPPRPLAGCEPEAAARCAGGGGGGGTPHRGEVHGAGAPDRV